MRSPVRPFAAALMAAIVTAACSDTPVEPLADAGSTDSIDALFLDAALPATEGSSADQDVPGHLERLLRRALGVLAEQGGEEAVRAATEELRALHAEAQRAREAGDEDAFRAAAQAAHMEAAGIVVRVLGTGPIERLRSFVAGRVREVQAALGDRPAPEVRALLDRARRLLRRSLGTDQADQALVAVAAAADLLSRLERPSDQPAATLYTLLGHALARVAMEEGADAARALRDRLAGLQQEAARARRAGDREAYRAAMNKLEGAMARVVLDRLGTNVLRRVLRAGSEGIQTLRHRLARIADAGGDPGALRRRLARATELHDQAVSAARTGRQVVALRAGALVLDVLAGIAD